MRLGETYLLRAEARFRQGNTAGAADDTTYCATAHSRSTVSLYPMQVKYQLRYQYGLHIG